MLVEFGSVLVGVNSATRVAAVYFTVPAMAAPVDVTFIVNVDVLIVFGSIGSLNVTVDLPARETPVAPFAGLVAITVGGVMSTVVTVDAAVSADLSEITPDLQLAATL
jgi:hypothetical protein